jgi:hypothetical protein
VIAVLDLFATVDVLVFFISPPSSLLRLPPEHTASRASFRADTSAVTLIQRFGSAANLSTHLHCLVLDGVYLNRAGQLVL